MGPWIWCRLKFLQLVFSVENLFVGLINLLPSRRFSGWLGFCLKAFVVHLDPREDLASSGHQMPQNPRSLLRAILINLFICLLMTESLISWSPLLTPKNPSLSCQGFDLLSSSRKISSQNYLLRVIIIIIALKSTGVLDRQTSPREIMKSSVTIISGVLHITDKSLQSCGQYTDV